MPYNTPEKVAAYRERTKERHGAYMKEYRVRKADDIAVSDKAWREVNREKIVEYEREYRSVNAKRIAETKRRWENRNKEWRRDYQQEYMRAYVSDNMPRFLARNAERRARKKGATPGWLTDSQRTSINTMYVAARSWGEAVDHIIPLTSDVVCGLHVPWNLQIITCMENSKKKNKLPSIDVRIYYGAPGYWCGGERCIPEKS